MSTPTTPHTPQAAQPRRRSVMVPAAVAVVAGAVALGGWLGSRAADDAPPAPSTEGTSVDGTAAPPAPDATTQTLEPITVGDVVLQPPPPSEFAYPGAEEESWTAPLEDRDPDGPYALGDPDAPVVLMIWSDFQCPFCRSWATETKPELMRFVEDGTLRMEWRDFPYLGPESSLAALAGRSAAEQDMFWEFHDALFAAEHSPNQGGFTEESLADLAEEAGLDREAFAASLNTVEQQEAVAADQDEGLALGVMGTPAFMINGMPVRGAQPTETFVQVVEDAAAARGAAAGAGD
ncbi:DsbA family protein [Ornithinimicrobium panacihumi]|uniref:DsbA family protein n=1 Tax=Ornithinimicrobium panacihumi TaxID=2008449 RepID=UPI003F8A7AFE